LRLHEIKKKKIRGGVAAVEDKTRERIAEGYSFFSVQISLKQIHFSLV
jgi:hypothetical protein